MTTNKRHWQVIEDNGGGIHLTLLSDDMQVIAMTSGYECNPENIHADIQAWHTTGTVAGWEGLESNPQGLYDSMTSSPSHGAIVAHGDVDGIEHHPNNMGSAARTIFASHIIGPAKQMQAKQNQKG